MSQKISWTLYLTENTSTVLRTRPCAPIVPIHEFNHRICLHTETHRICFYRNAQSPSIRKRTDPCWRAAGSSTCWRVFPAQCFQIKLSEWPTAAVPQTTRTGGVLWSVRLQEARGTDGRLQCELLWWSLDTVGGDGAPSTAPQHCLATWLCLVASGAKREEDVSSWKQKRKNNHLLWNLTNGGRKSSFYSTIPYKLKRTLISSWLTLFYCLHSCFCLCRLLCHCALCALSFSLSFLSQSSSPPFQPLLFHLWGLHSPLHFHIFPDSLFLPSFSPLFSVLFLFYDKIKYNNPGSIKNKTKTTTNGTLMFDFVQQCARTSLPFIHLSSFPPDRLLLCMSVFTLLLNYYSCTDCKMYYFVQLYWKKLLLEDPCALITTVRV